LGWAVVLLVAERRARTRTTPSTVSRAASRRSLQLGAIGAVVIVSLLACFASGPRERRDQLEYRADRQIAATVKTAVGGDHRVLVNGAGYAAWLGLAPSLAVELTNAGHQVYVPSDRAGGYGKSRAVGRKPYDVAIWITSSPTPPPGIPGKELLRVDLDAVRNQAIATLIGEARGKKFVPSPDAPQIAKRMAGNKSAGVALFHVLARQIAAKPAQYLAGQSVAKLIQQGYFQSPKFDPKALDRVATLPDVTSWGDRYFTVWQLTPAEVHKYYPWVS
jgi:hypothetical protein